MDQAVTGRIERALMPISTALQAIEGTIAQLKRPEEDLDVAPPDPTIVPLDVEPEVLDAPNAQRELTKMKLIYCISAVARSETDEGTFASYTDIFQQMRWKFLRGMDGIWCVGCITSASSCLD